MATEPMKECFPFLYVLHYGNVVTKFHHFIFNEKEITKHYNIITVGSNLN